MTTTWEFRLPIPPSTNGLFSTSKRGHRHVSKKYAAWIDDAKKWLTLQKRPAEPITYLVGIDIHVPFIPRADVSNRIKAVEDICVKAGILKDDSLVERVTARWSDGVDCIVTLSPERAVREGAA